MIFKCGECSYVWEGEDPAVGFEDRLDAGMCPNCMSRLDSPARQIRILMQLRVAQFVALVGAISSVIFAGRAGSLVWLAILVVSTFLLSHLQNNKGKPFVLQRARRSSRSGIITAEENIGS